MSYRLLITGLLMLWAWSPWQLARGQALADEPILKHHRDDERVREDEFPENLISGFVKTGEELPPGVMFFNVLRVENPTQEAFSFIPVFDIPPRSKLILQDHDLGVLTLGPGQSRFIPIRVSFPADAEGGITYEVTGQLRSREDTPLTDPTTSTVVYQRISQWRVTASFAKVYASSRETGYTPVIFSLFNEGNALEPLKLTFEAGELLEMEEGLNGHFSLDLPLRPSTDTTLRVHVRATDFSPEMAVGSRHKLRLTVRSENTPDSVAEELLVSFEAVDDRYQHAVSEDEAALIINVNQSNLGSRDTRTNVTLGGNLLLSQDRTLSYRYSFQHNFLQPGSDSLLARSLLRDSRFQLGYSTPTSQIQIGDVSAGQQVILSGRGLSASHQVKKGTQVDGTVVAKRGGGWGLATGIRTTITEGVLLNGGVSYQQDPETNLRLLAPSLGAGIRLGQHQRLDVQGTMTRQQSYGREVAPVDRKGVGLEGTYSLGYDRLRAELTGSYASADFEGIGAGTTRLRADASYRFLNRSTLKAQVEHQGNTTRDAAKDGTVESEVRTQNQRLNLGYQFRAGQLPITLTGGLGRTTMQKESFLQETSRELGLNNWRVGAGTVLNHPDKKEVSLATSVSIGQTRVGQVSHLEEVPQSNFWRMEANMRAHYRGGSLSLAYEKAPALSPQQAIYETEKVKYDHLVTLGSTFQKELIPQELTLQANAHAALNARTKELQAALQGSLNYQNEAGWGLSFDLNLDPTAWFGKKATVGSGTTMNLSARKVIYGQQPRLKYYHLQLLFFKDLNGNRESDSLDTGLGNILVKAHRLSDPVPGLENHKIEFNAPDIMSNQEGWVNFAKVPEGNYLLSLREMFPPMQYTNLFGEELEVRMKQNVTLMVPYSRAITITGNVKITRDKYSREHGVSPANIRVTVFDATGASYHTLTDDRGNYLINVPFSERYTLRMANVLGEKFELVGAEQALEATLEDQRFEILFHFKEKGRSINFGS